MDYREEIYAHYASKIQDSDGNFNPEEALKWGRTYSHYFKGWLPTDKSLRILELACGSGRLLYCLKHWGYENITGVDLSREQVALSRQAIEDCVFEEDAVSFMGRNPDSFDVIIAIDLVEHYSKSEMLPFLISAYAAIKSNGIIIIQTPNADSPMGLSLRYGDFTHEVIYNPNSLSRLLSISGFRNIQSKETRPVVHGMYSLTRYCLWIFLRISVLAWNLIETGSIQSGITTRNFLIRGEKRAT